MLSKWHQRGYSRASLPPKLVLDVLLPRSEAQSSHTRWVQPTGWNLQGARHLLQLLTWSRNCRREREASKGGGGGTFPSPTGRPCFCPVLAGASLIVMRGVTGAHPKSNGRLPSLLQGLTRHQATSWRPLPVEGGGRSGWPRSLPCPATGEKGAWPKGTSGAVPQKTWGPCWGAKARGFEHC